MRRCIAILLVLSLAFGSLSCTSKARRITGGILGLSGLTMATGGLVVILKGCEENETGNPVSNCFDAGPPEVGWSVFGLGLLLTAVGAYLFFFTTDAEPEPEPEVEDWSNTVRLPTTPEQVAHGTFKVKHIPRQTVICTTGGLEKAAVDAAIATLVKHKQEYELGSLYINFIEEAKAEVCFPIDMPAPEEPVTKDDVVLKEVPAHRVLSIFYRGRFDRPALEELLHGELEKRSLKAAGPTRHAGHTDPGNIPLDQNLGELMIPVL